MWRPSQWNEHDHLKNVISPIQWRLHMDRPSGFRWENVWKCEQTDGRMNKTRMHPFKQSFFLNHMNFHLNLPVCGLSHDSFVEVPRSFYLDIIFILFANVSMPTANVSTEVWTAPDSFGYYGIWPLLCKNINHKNKQLLIFNNSQAKKVS